MPEAAIDYQVLAQHLIRESGGAALGRREKAAVSSTPTTIYGHGTGGLFSNPATERPVISAMILPHMGLQGRIPIYPNNTNDPLYAIVTGVTATTGSEPSGPCDDFPVAGTMKLCQQTSVFGREGRMSRVFELDRIGQKSTRGEHFDFRLLGNAWTGTDSGLVPTIPGGMGGDMALNYEYGKAAFELAVAWSRDFARDFYTGSPANNVGTGRMYFRGLDALINTGYRDAITGQVCAAADSDVRSFQNQNMSTAGAGLVRTLTDMYNKRRYIASRAGLDPVKWVFVMRWSAFYELSEVWPCAYSTYRCQTSFSTSQTQVTDTQRLLEMRDEMRGDMYNYTGQYLLIDGQRVEVVIDDSITEDGTGAGTYQSRIYLAPLTILGGVPVLYMEHRPYDGSEAPGSAMQFAQQMGFGSYYKTSDNGRFLWHFKPPTNYCVQFMLKTEPRLILRTPFLAAVLTNVRYTPLSHEREPFTDSTYFVDGGVTSYNGYGPSYYSPTS